MTSPNTLCADHVIIRGHVFTFAEKAPFVRSGASVLGAIEYDNTNDRIRCHECGEWFESLSAHIPAAHSLSVRDYRERHGLSLTAKLNSFSAIEKFRHNSTKSESFGSSSARNKGLCLMRQTVKGPRKRRPQHQKANLKGKCAAQTLFRIQVLAAQLGRTPKHSEIVALGLDSRKITRIFGSVSRAIELCGLTPNYSNQESEMPSLPKGFPTEKQLKEARMPWPKDYFGVTEDIALRRRAS